jgi:16S rRNA (cytosine1402-N4)-methyltransferase
MFEHVTVLKNEAVEGLCIRPDGVYVDCTLGGAGHSMTIASRLGSEGHLIGLDQDNHALANAEEALRGFPTRLSLIKTNFRDLSQVLQEQGVFAVDGFLFDLGVSSPQLDEAERGFSYQHDAPLDMRMDQEQSLTAHTIVNEWSEQALADVIYQYGEERFSRRIARNIVKYREKTALQTTLELVEVIKSSIPAAARRKGPHPAKRTFQALRIAVNDELRAFEVALHQTLPLLKKGGRIAVITFHSLEDRICKQFFKKHRQGCTCTPDFPQCVCGRVPQLKVKTRKPVTASEYELESNPRSRSAKLRVAEKLTEESPTDGNVNHEF